MKTYRNLQISYKMNNINVRLCTMQSNDSLIHDACAKCKGDVGRKKYCKSCGLEDKDRDAKGTKWLKPLQILKAFSISKTEKKVFSEEQLDDLKEFEKNLVIDGVLNTPIEDRYIEGMYYILPSDNLDAYSMLYAGLKGSKKSLIVKYALFGKQKIGAITISGDALVLVKLFYEEQIRKLDEVLKLDLSKENKKIGTDFLKNLPSMDLSKITDKYAEKLAEFLDGQGELIEGLTPTAKSSKKSKKPKAEAKAFFTA